MENGEWISMDAIWVAVRLLAHDLGNTHAEPFAPSFLEEHWDTVLKVLQGMGAGQLPDQVETSSKIWNFMFQKEKGYKPELVTL